MHFLRRSREYLRDNPEGYWFKRKVYGWGWVPATWQGWATLGVFLIIFTLLTYSFASSEGVPQDTDIFAFLGSALGWALVLILTCYITGEPPKWQWGFPEHKE